MSRLLITGAAGFIGSVVCRQLLETGAGIVGIDNLNDYYDPELKKWRLGQLTSHANFQFAEVDIEDASAVTELFQKNSFDCVLNLAARAGVRYSLENPVVYMTTNALGNLHLLEAMRQHNVKKYVLASTSSLYAGQQMPFVESLPVNEPISPYAATKKAAEAMAYAYHHLFDIDVSIVRYFTVYGPAGRPDMSYFRFISWMDRDLPIHIYGDGEQSRDFTFVEDIAAGTIKAMKPLGFEVINLGGGNNPYSINGLIEKLEQIMGKTARVEYHPFSQADMISTWANIDKAARLLDWRPTVGLDTGLKRCVDWYFANQPWSAQIPLD